MMMTMMLLMCSSQHIYYSSPICPCRPLLDLPPWIYSPAVCMLHPETLYMHGMSTCIYIYEYTPRTTHTLRVIRVHTYHSAPVSPEWHCNTKATYCTCLFQPRT